MGVRWFCGAQQAAGCQRASRHGNAECGTILSADREGVHAALPILWEGASAPDLVQDASRLWQLSASAPFLMYPMSKLTWLAFDLAFRPERGGRDAASRSGVE